MSSTKIDIDDRACDEIMRRYKLSSKQEAVNFALRLLANEPMSVDEARRLRGVDWEGNLFKMRSTSAL